MILKQLGQKVILKLDYAGPLYIKENKDSVSKVYILLFTCASSHALHPELTPDMKVPAFIRVLVVR